jgi:hypothetical protein
LFDLSKYALLSSGHWHFVSDLFVSSVIIVNFVVIATMTKKTIVPKNGLINKLNITNYFS